MRKWWSIIERYIYNGRNYEQNSFEYSMWNLFKYIHNMKVNCIEKMKAGFVHILHQSRSGINGGLRSLFDWHRDKNLKRTWVKVLSMISSIESQIFMLVEGFCESIYTNISWLCAFLIWIELNTHVTQMKTQQGCIFKGKL